MLETDRLILRRPRLSDASALFAFLGDAKAMRYTTKLPTLRACRRHIAGHECQRRKLGYGPWTIIDKRDGRVIGFGGLYDDPFDPGWGSEISYRFAPSAWGQGFATELTNFCLTYARDHLSRSEIIAFAHPHNAESRRVLEKTGFKLQRFLPGMERYLYGREL